jgi:hypothetical protein
LRNIPDEGVAADGIDVDVVDQLPESIGPCLFEGKTREG